MRDTSAFFQEATSKICGSLNIEESLWESIKFLGKYIPADEIYLDIYNPSQGSLRVLAQATPQGGQRINKIIPLTDEVRKLVDLNCSREKMPYDKVLILNRPDKHTVAKFLCSSMNLVQSSILTMFRIIAATHRDLQAMVDAGQFRQDLWFRLNVFPISIPPLRERKEDIPALTRHIAKMKCQNLGFMDVPRISKECMDELLAYEWPGNIRELENLIERELIQNNGQIDSSANLPPTSHPRPRTAGPEPGFASLDENMTEHIQRALTYSQGKIHGPNGAADLLGIHPNTLRYRMKKLGIPFRKKDRGVEGRGL